MNTTKIYGPPGTGKTTTGMNIVSQEIAKGLHPSQIAYCTFAKSAIEEAKQRANCEDLQHFRTLHSFCYHAANVTKDQVVDNKKLQEFAELVGTKISYTSGQYSEAQTDGDEVLMTYNKCRNRLDEHYIRNYYGKWNRFRFNHLIESYETWKSNNDYLDFTDFLFAYNQRGDAIPVTVAIIDEAQDITRLQFQVLSKMFANVERMYLLGDDDQSIYVFSGADAANFLNWKADSETVLSKSYRLPRVIKDYSQKIISRVKDRKDKQFEPVDKEGEIQRRHLQSLHVDDFKGTTFILTRNRYLNKDIRTKLDLWSVPYIVKNDSSAPFNDIKQLTALKSWVKILDNDFIIGDVKKCIEFVPMNILVHGTKTKIKDMPLNKNAMSQQDLIDIGFKELPEWYEGIGRLPNKFIYNKAIKQFGWDVIYKEPKVQFMTLHQSKGMEADTVIILPDMSRRSFLSYKNRPDDEHRLFYVGVTRAKQKLIWMYNQSDRFYK